MELLSPHLSRWPPIKSCNIALSIAPEKQVIMWRKKVATMDLPCRPVYSNQNITKLCEGSSGIFKGIIILFFFSVQLQPIFYYGHYFTRALPNFTAI